MLEIIQFLMENQDVLQKLQEGMVSLIGVNADETKAILEVFFDVQNTVKDYYWN